MGGVGTLGWRETRIVPILEEKEKRLEKRVFSGDLLLRPADVVSTGLVIVEVSETK